MLNKKINKKNITNQKISAAERTGKIRKILFFFALFIFLGVAFWFLFFSSFVRINHIRVNGLQDEIVMNIVQEVQSVPLGGFISQDNILLLFPSRIEKKIGENLILAQDIEVKKVFPDTIEIYFKERDDVIVWCQGEMTANCFLVDEKGEAFYQMKDKEEFGEHFPVVLSRGSLDIKIGGIIIKPELAKFCSEISSFSQKEAEIKLDNVYYTPSFMSGEIKVRTDRGWDVYFNSFSTAYEQSNLLKSILADNIKKEDIEKLEYIDLRLSGKVLYKLREQEVKGGEIEGNFKEEEKKDKT